MAILFGEILGTTTEQLVAHGSGRAWRSSSSRRSRRRPFLLLSFDPEQADVAGFSSRRYHALMLLLVALTVVVAFEAVGTLLVFGMLLAPAATGALLAHRIGSMMVVAVLVGVALDVSRAAARATGSTSRASATIVLIAVAIFFVVLRS